MGYYRAETVGKLLSLILFAPLTFKSRVTIVEESSHTAHGTLRESRPPKKMEEGEGRGLQISLYLNYSPATHVIGRMTFDLSDVLSCAACRY